MTKKGFIDVGRFETFQLPCEDSLPSLLMSPALVPSSRLRAGSVKSAPAASKLVGIFYVWHSASACFHLGVFGRCTRSPPSIGLNLPSWDGTSRPSQESYFGETTYGVRKGADIDHYLHRRHQQKHYSRRVHLGRNRSKAIVLGVGMFLTWKHVRGCHKEFCVLETS